MEQQSILFTEKLKTHAKYKTGYPDEAIDLILKPYRNQEEITVVDVGAGSGMASRMLADKGAKVIAVETNRAMIESAEFHPNITYKQARAETTPLDRNYADIVTSFQAFHWFDFKKSLKEFNRILKPGGRLALIWNYTDITDAFTASYTKLLDEATQKNSDRVEPYDGFSGKIKKLKVRILWKFKYLPYYRNVRQHTFKLIRKMDLYDLIGYAETQKYIRHEGKEWDKLLTDIIALESRHKCTNLVYNINVFTAEPVK
jgi:SAM-dependent methyltransferase